MDQLRVARNRLFNALKSKSSLAPHFFDLWRVTIGLKGKELATELLIVAEAAHNEEYIKKACLMGALDFNTGLPACHVLHRLK